MGQYKIGKESYVRSEEHRKKMSISVSNRDMTEAKVRMAAISSARKGKSLEEIYGVEKAIKLKERLRGQVGEKNPNWRGGVHRNKYPYIFIKLRISILERDGYVCQNCRMTQHEAKTKDRFERGLTIHHIDYDKENNSLKNLITLCKWCNSSANSERESWIIKYQSLLGA